jgi:hypothetical protein
MSLQLIMTIGFKAVVLGMASYILNKEITGRIK